MASYSTLHIDGCNFQELEFAIKKATMKGLYESAYVLMNESQSRIPIDTGAAYNSRVINVDIESNAMGKVEAGYGGVNTKINPKNLLPTTAYLNTIHEYHAKKHFLSDPFNSLIPFIFAHVKSKINKVMRTNSLGG
jgi:hypothetical protein